MALSPTTEIIEDLRKGRMVILIDEEDRENEGDLVLAADHVTPEAINFMARHGRGLICLTLTEEKCRQLNLTAMVAHNSSPLGTNFTVSIEAAKGVTTGISAADRARTIQAAARADAGPTDIVQPGHIFPLMAQRGGVLMRAGHTEAGCDLAALAGLTPASVICEILKDDGEMARLPDLIEFGKQHDLKIGSIADLIHFRNRTESLVKRVSERPVETPYGTLQLVVYSEKMGDATHMALVKGDIKSGIEALVRVHEPVSVIDLLDVNLKTHSWNLHQAMAAISRAPCGVMVLLYKPESAAELRDRAEQDATRTPQKSALRTYGIGSQILRDLGVAKMRLMARPRRMPSMAGYGLQVTGYLLPEDVSNAAS